MMKNIHQKLYVQSFKYINDKNRSWILMNPLISVIVPVYNVELYVNRCIDSILAQTYKNFEVILIDDGSTDNSGHICDEYAKVDKRINVIHTKNKGLSSARNMGIEKSVGKYIIFCDSDDWIEEKAMENVLENVNYESVDLIIFGYSMDFPHENNIIKVDCINKEFESVNEFLLNYKFYRGNYLFGFVWNKLFRSEIIKNNNLIFELGVFPEDLFFCFKYMHFCKNIKSVNCNLYHYMHESINTLSKKKKDELKVMNDIYSRTKEFLIIENSFMINREYVNSTYIEGVCSYILTNLSGNQEKYKTLKELYNYNNIRDCMEDFNSCNKVYEIMFFFIKNRLYITTILFLYMYNIFKEVTCKKYK